MKSTTPGRTPVPSGPRNGGGRLGTTLRLVVVTVLGSALVACGSDAPEAPGTSVAAATVPTVQETSITAGASSAPNASPSAPTDQGAPTAACGAVPGDSPLGAAQASLDAALRPFVVDPATGRPDAASAAALPAWLFSPSTTIVGLGEATHGTKEINDARAAIVLEIAARTRGPLVFLIEDEYVRAAALDAYLEDGTGTAAAGLMELRNIWWKNRELVALMERLRSLREADPERRIVFRGVDMQDPDRIFAAIVDAAKVLGAESAASADIATAVAGIETYAGAAAAMIEAYGKGAAFDYAPTLAARKQVLAALGRLRATFEAAPGAGLTSNTRARLLHTVRVAEQNTWKIDPLSSAYGAYGADPDVKAWLDKVAATVPAADRAPGVWEARDRAMAENAAAMVALEGDGARGVFWGHNGHVSHEASSEAKPAGAYLREQLGTRYRALGTEFYAGSFVSAPSDAIEVFTIDGSPASFFANAAARLCRQAGILDLTTLSGALATELAKPLDQHGIGGDYDPGRSPDRGVLGERYDGLLFLRDTNAAELLS